MNARDIMTPKVITVTSGGDRGARYAARGDCDNARAPAELSSVTVENGVVTFAGLIETENERIAARVAAESIPGVRGVVDDRLACRDHLSMV
jgi:hypothetical protein